MSLALYRKYRSADFSELIGQAHVTGPLMQALSAGRINHAYLFSGPRGCGKTSSARILARSLNCAAGPTATPCGVCPSCIDLAPNGSGSIDVIEIDAASHGGVDDARDLRERAYYAPARDRYKVYIIDEAHMVTTQGFNALLKLVEEPPDFLVFIFATTEPDKVLTTIRSRTHHYPFRLIAPSVLRAHLERICQLEQAVVQPTVFSLVVRSGGGSARDSLSILDQLLAGAGAEGVTYEMAVGLLGVTDSALLDDMTEALAVGDAAAVYAAIDRVVEAGHDPRRFAADLLERFRDLIMLDAVPDAVACGLIDYPADQVAAMLAQARRTGAASLVRFADITHTTLTEMRGTTSPRLMLELLSARMLLPDASADSGALLQRLERLERRMTLGVPAVVVPAPSVPAGVAPAADAPTGVAPVGVAPTGVEPIGVVPAVDVPAGVAPPVDAPPVDVPSPGEPVVIKPEPGLTVVVAPDPEVPEVADAAPGEAATAQPVVAANTGSADSAGLRRLWPDVLDQVKAKSRRTRALLDNAAIAKVDGAEVTLAATSAVIAKMLADESNLSALRQALEVVFGAGWTIKIEVDSVKPAPEPDGIADPDAGAGPDGRPQPEGRTQLAPPSDRPSAKARAAASKANAERDLAPKPAQSRAGRSLAPREVGDDGVDEAADVVQSTSTAGVSVEDAAIALLRNSLGAHPLPD